MKISKIHFPKLVRTTALTLPFLFSSVLSKGQIQENKQDVFIKSNPLEVVTDSVSTSPAVIIADQCVYPAVVVDLSEKYLYHYDLDGTLIDVYPVAVGKKSTPTRTGVRIVREIENYPYASAPKTTKRYKNPNDYGTKVLCLDEVDPKTGKIIPGNGQFIHGTFKPESIGKNVSKGCVRLKNEDVEALSSRLYKNQYVLIKE